MQCEDNSKLRIPLSEVCKTTDIGCVPITSGKPTCTPQPDEIPIAFDPSTTTLWLFSCKTHDWVAFQKFKLDQLAKMNMDNIRNICEVLNIAVWYDSNSAHVQGTVTLGQLADEILNCIQLKTRTLILQNNTLKTWVEGLDALPPYFIKGNNIWFEGGTGTESDPLRIATHDPICNWPTKSQAQVDAANVKHLGACVDGQMSRVPFPPKVCELPSKSEAQVKASPNKSLIACVDGEGAKVPYPKEPCELPALSQEQVDASLAKMLIACVDNQSVKVPYIESDPPLCDLPLSTLSQISSAGDNATLAVCLDGKPSRMPVPSGMFVPEYICVPKVTAKPTSPPEFGTGPLRMGCNSELYVWLCNENRWEGVIPDHNVFRPLDPNDVANIRENLHIAAWYPAGSDECTQNVYVTVNQLFDLLGGNELMKESIEIIAADVSNICKFPVTTNDKIAGANVPLCVDGGNVKTTVSNFASVLGNNSSLVNSVTNSSGFGTRVNEIVKSNVSSNTNNITNTITEKVIESNDLNTKVNELVRNQVNNNTNNLTTSIVDKVVSSGRLQNPICSLSTTNKANVKNNWSNVTVPLCENGASKKISINDFYDVIIDNYTPPDDRECQLPFEIKKYTLYGANGIINPETGARAGSVIAFNNIQLKPVGSTGINAAVYQSSEFGFIAPAGATGVMQTPRDESRFNHDVGQAKITIENRLKCRCLCELDLNIRMARRYANLDYGVTAFACLSEVSKEPWNAAVGIVDTTNPNNFTDNHAVVSFHAMDNRVYGGSWDNWNTLAVPHVTAKALAQRHVIIPGGSQNNPGVKNFYMQFFIVFSSRTLTEIESVSSLGIIVTANLKIFRGIVI